MLQFQDNGVFTNKPGNTFDALGSDATEGGLIRLKAMILQWQQAVNRSCAPAAHTRRYITYPAECDAGRSAC